jgi:outer membrane protein assembly factor BamE (lipoprotein component of BamABCDE complex)
LAALLVLSLPRGGCLAETYQKGYVVPEGALEQIPIGASQEQVLIVLGTPSTVATVSGEVFYYISQRSERRVAFLQQGGRGSARGCGLFRQEPAGRAAGQYGMKTAGSSIMSPPRRDRTRAELYLTFFQVFDFRM